MITLADAKQLSQDKLTDKVIDEFATSPILAEMEFDDTVKPQGGKSMTYSYNRITTQPKAGTRAIGGDYQDQETITTQEHVDLKIMGGSYKIDRVIAKDEVQVVKHVEFQSTQKTKATVAEFHDLFINGDSAQNAEQFDGLDKIVTGSPTEIVPEEPIDLSTAAAIKENYGTFLYDLRKLISKMGKASHFAMNADLFMVFQALSDIVPNISFTRDELGKEIGHYGSTTLVQMGDVTDATGKAVPIIANDEETGTTSLYAFNLSLADGVHGVSPEGSKVVEVYAPNMNDANAMKRGAVEFVAAIAVESSKAAGALRNIQVVPAAEE
jgi:hypothetical protein